MTKITISAINLQSGVATTKGYAHYLLTGWKYWLPHSQKPLIEAAEMLKEEQVDIACITEISEPSLRTGYSSQTELLRRQSSLHHTHFFSLQKRGTFFFHEGNSLISTYPIVRFFSHLLHVELTPMSLDETTLDIHGQEITVFIAHLALTKRHREIQVKEIVDIIKDRKGPIILAGDFNERDPDALSVLLKNTPLSHMCTQKTYPSWDPRHSIDYIFLSSEFSVQECSIPKRKAFSDHVALIVKAELK